MAPKKNKKNKNDPSVKVYTFLTAQEMKVREMRYAQRLNELKVCVHFIEGKSIYPPSALGLMVSDNLILPMD